MTLLTTQAQDLIATILQSGETAIDATAGNGHDSHFLCKTVGSTGSIYAFDIQQAALDHTADRLQQSDFSNFKLLHSDHRRLKELIPAECHQRIGAIMFNLGYLPGGDHTMITQEQSTIAGIEAALCLLRSGGILTVLAYPGHPGGVAETEAVSALLSQLETTQYIVKVLFAQSESTEAPRLFIVKKISL